MHPLVKSLVVAFAVSSTLCFAQPRGEVVIRSRDGKTRMGRIISETSKGYLLSGPDGTTVVEFSAITDIRELASQAPSPPPFPEPMPVPVAAAAPAPQPERSIDAPVVTATAPEGAPQAPVREGFHFGVGAEMMALPTGFLARAQAHFDFTFGRPAYRISANVGVQQLYSRLFIVASIDNLFQFNVTDIYSFGGGVQIGLAMGRPSMNLYLAPVIQPVILKFGDRGQHQLSVTASLVVLSSVYQDGYSGSPISLEGTPQAFVGYSYLF